MNNENTFTITKEIWEMPFAKYIQLCETKSDLYSLRILNSIRLNLSTLISHIIDDNENVDEMPLSNIISTISYACLVEKEEIVYFTVLAGKIINSIELVNYGHIDFPYLELLKIMLEKYCYFETSRNQKIDSIIALEKNSIYITNSDMIGFVASVDEIVKELKTRISHGSLDESDNLKTIDINNLNDISKYLKEIGIQYSKIGRIV